MAEGCGSDVHELIMELYYIEFVGELFLQRGITGGYLDGVVLSPVKVTTIRRPQYVRRDFVALDTLTPPKPQGVVR
jgi:hypothetical protein